MDELKELVKDDYVVQTKSSYKKHVTITPELKKDVLAKGVNKKNWTPSEDRLLLEQVNNGILYSQIAIEMNRTENAILNRVHALRKKGMANRKKQMRPNSSKRWTNAEDQLVLNYHKLGLPKASIAKQLGRSTGSIYNRLYDLTKRYDKTTQQSHNE